MGEEELKSIISDIKNNSPTLVKLTLSREFPFYVNIFRHFIKALQQNTVIQELNIKSPMLDTEDFIEVAQALIRDRSFTSLHIEGRTLSLYLKPQVLTGIDNIRKIFITNNYKLSAQHIERLWLLTPFELSVELLGNKLRQNELVDLTRGKPNLKRLTIWKRCAENSEFSATKYIGSLKNLITATSQLSIFLSDRATEVNYDSSNANLYMRLHNINSAETNTLISWINSISHLKEIHIALLDDDAMNHAAIFKQLSNNLSLVKIIIETMSLTIAYDATKTSNIFKVSLVGQLLTATYLTGFFERLPSVTDLTLLDCTFGYKAYKWLHKYIKNNENIVNFAVEDISSSPATVQLIYDVLLNCKKLTTLDFYTDQDNAYRGDLQRLLVNNYNLNTICTDEKHEADIPADEIRNSRYGLLNAWSAFCGNKFIPSPERRVNDAHTVPNAANYYKNIVTSNDAKRVAVSIPADILSRIQEMLVPGGIGKIARFTVS